MTIKKKYSMAFSTGSLFHHDSMKIASLYSDIGDWKKVRETVSKENILQARTLTTVEIISREIISRLKLLSDNELTVLTEGSPQDQEYILWIAVCRRYRFIYEFAVEVLREKYLTLQYELNYDDFDAFFNSKASWHEELERITDSTRKKLRQVLFRILREVGLLTPDNMILPAMLSSEIIKAVKETSRKDFSVFPVSESDLTKWVK